LSRLKVASPYGIPVYLHWTFALLIIYGIYLTLNNQVSFIQFFWIFLFSVSLFICVALHELGHALVARKFNIVTKDIILSPIGGVARLVKLPEKPKQELLISAAGPMVNLAIFLFLFVIYIFVFEKDIKNELSGLADQDSNIFLIQSTPFHLYFYGLMMLNLILALFNLLPAFPMDGGRILRAALTLKMGKERATNIAVFIGQILSIGLIYYGVVNQNLMSAFIGIFVFQSARREKLLSKMDKKARAICVKDIKLANHSPVFLHTSWRVMDDLPEYFPVFDSWMNVIGIGSKSDWKKAGFVRVTQDLDKFLLPGENLKSAIDKIVSEDKKCLPIYDQGNIRSVLSLTQIDQILAT
jgi:Zn-dependent protease